MQADDNEIHYNTSSAHYTYAAFIWLGSVSIITISQKGPIITNHIKFKLNENIINANFNNDESVTLAQLIYYSKLDP